MTPEQFCYWLQGRAELVEGPPSEGEWAVIREHLGLVFQKVTAVRSPNPYQGLGGVAQGGINPAIQC